MINYGSVTQTKDVPTKEYVDNKVPTKTSQLTNDSGFVDSLSDLGVTATAAELNYVDGVTSNVQTQLNAKAPKSSPAFTGTPTAPTAASGTSTTQIATTAFVGNEVTGFVKAVAPAGITTVNPVNADTLGGFSPSSYLKKTDVVDSLDSTAINLPLSAYQGKLLKDSITDFANEITNKAPLASPTFTGTPKATANTSYATAQLRNVIYSTAEPTSSDGNNGDLWIVYEA